MTDEDLLEMLASQAHDRWSGWMRHLCSRTRPDYEGAALIPAKWVERWRRQCDTPYEALSEKEKESDRKEARKTLDLMRETGRFTPRPEDAP